MKILRHRNVKQIDLLLLLLHHHHHHHHLVLTMCHCLYSLLCIYFFNSFHLRDNSMEPVLQIDQRRFTPNFLCHGSQEHAEADNRNLCSHIWFSTVSGAGKGKIINKQSLTSESKFDSKVWPHYHLSPQFCASSSQWVPPSPTPQVPCTLVMSRNAQCLPLHHHPPGCTTVKSPQCPRPHLTLHLHKNWSSLWPLPSHLAPR